MSSPFQKQFSSKSPMSPLNGAYAEGRDRDIRTYRQSDRELFAKLQNDIIKHSGDAEAAMNERSGGKVDINDFRQIRKMIEDSSNNEEPED